MIGKRFNFEDSFFRDLTVSVLDTLEGEVKWINRFSSGDRIVNVPFYYSLTGDERFLLDSFSDDIVSDNRYVDLNTDIIPRGHLTLTGYDIRSDEFANPNVWLKMVFEHDNEIRKVLSKIRAIPITAKYELTILLSSEIDTFKCSQAIMDTIWLYRFMYFEHNFMNIDAVMIIPDTSQIQIQREKNLTSDNTIKLTLSFDVQTYYPAYRKPKLPQTISYPVQTQLLNRNISAKVQIFRGNVNNIIFTEYHNVTTSSDGQVFLNIGAGAKFDFNTEELQNEGTPIENYVQLPNFKYKKVIFDNSGSPLNNQTVGVKATILKNNESGDALYIEDYTLKTDSLGQMSFEIGLGNIDFGNLMRIDWNNGIYFLKIELDTSGGTNYSVLENKLFSANFTGDVMSTEFNVPTNVQVALNQGIVALTTALLSVVPGSNGKSYQAFWPYLPPAGIDRSTGNPYQYGLGYLTGITAASGMNGLVSENYSLDYFPILRDVNGDPVSGTLGSVVSRYDNRDWYFDYDRGILYQNKIDPPPIIPETIDVYYLLGKKPVINTMPPDGQIGDLLSLYNNRNNLRICVGIDPNGGDNYEMIINGEDFNVLEFNPDPNSNTFDFGTDTGAFQDTILYPKRTRWYMRNKTGNMGDRRPMENNPNANTSKFGGRFSK